MKPLPAPPLNARPARVAAAQRSDLGPTSAVIRRGTPSIPGDAKYLSNLNDWQAWIRRYARTMGIVRFSAGITADTIARVTPRVEEMTESGDWIEASDPRMVGLFDEYRNPRQSPAELVHLHAWFYATVGESVQTMRDTPQGIEWGLWSMASAQWDKPERGSVLIRFTPDGKITNDGADTAFAVPREYATRFWIPDEEWQAYATSPMAASVDDLKRLRSLTRHATRKAESFLAMNDMVWMPDDGWDQTPPGDIDPNEDTGPAPQNVMEQAWYELAKLGFTDDDDIAAIAPALFHWAQQYGPPQYVSMGEAFDAGGISYRDEARQDFARGTNLPASLVVGGGPGDANHWTEWLVDRKFFDSAIAPTCNRIFHQDLTQTFLAPRLRVAGLDPRHYRMGYDPMPVIVKADQSGQAIPAWLAGLLGPEGALELMNIDSDKLASPADLERLFAVLQAKAAGEPPMGGGTAPGGVKPPPADANTVVEAPPSTNGNTPVAASAGAPSPVRVASVLGRALLAYSEDQERDESGRFGQGQGDSAQGPPGSGTREDPFRVASASEAQALIHDGKYVEMPSDQVSVLLDKLAAISADARAKGEKAPLYDLCKISVPDTNMFCGGTKGIPRVEMPQLAGIARAGTEADALPKDSKGETDITGALRSRLTDEGVGFDDISVPADTLRATQNELNGAKVAGMMEAKLAGTLPAGRIFVSRDNYVVDGHHRWAADVGAGFVTGEPMNMDVTRVDMPIAELIGYVNTFASDLGMQQMAASLRLLRSLATPRSPV